MCDSLLTPRLQPQPVSNSKISHMSDAAVICIAMHQLPVSIMSVFSIGPLEDQCSAVVATSK